MGGRRLDLSTKRYGGGVRKGFFDFSGQPMRWLTDTSVPEIYRGNGRWEEYRDIMRVLQNADPITDKSEFDADIIRFDAMRAELDGKA